MTNSRSTKTKKDNTVGLCNFCEKYIAHGHYKITKIGRDHKIICEWCEASMGGK